MTFDYYIRDWSLAYSFICRRLAMSYIILKLAKSILGVSGSVVCIHCKARIDGLFQAEARGGDHQGIGGRKVLQGK